MRSQFYSFNEYFPPNFVGRDLQKKICENIKSQNLSKKMDRFPLVQKYFCEFCKLPEEPNKIEQLKWLEKCICGLILRCKDKDKCATEKWPEHQELWCIRRQADWQKWKEFIPLFDVKTFDDHGRDRFYELANEFGQHRFRIAFETLAIAEEKQELFAFQEALRVFEYAMFAENKNATAFGIQDYENYSVAKIAATYLYLLMTLGQVDVIKEKFIDAVGDIYKMFKLPGPQKKRHFLAKVAEILVTVMQAQVPEDHDDYENFKTFRDVMKDSPADSVQQKIYTNGIPMDLIRKHLVQLEYKDFVEKNGDNIYRKMKPFYQRLLGCEQSIFDIICGYNITPKNKYGVQLLEMGRILRKYFERYPNKAVLLREQISLSKKEKRDWSDVDSDEEKDFGDLEFQGQIAAVDFALGMIYDDLVSDDDEASDGVE